MSRPTLRGLPPELHALITSYLPPLSLHLLSLTSRYFSHLIGPVHLSKQDTLTIRLHYERLDSSRYHRVCSKCIRLRQFWHFSHKQAGAKTQADMRTCLDCFLKACNPLSTEQRIKWFFGETIVVCEKCRQLVRVEGKEVFPHMCRAGREPERVGGGREPSVDRIREALGRLEERLPPRKLWALKHDYPRDDLEDTLKALEDYAKRLEAAVGGDA
ncbi:hypothetical protein K440DRAFT_609917 [Wilcoxina mikolae CBS 423.85]|nr:hypothetical protein K440DRAFT_609917 [Wilcoxina mikolae CBS 423.85]